MKDLISVIIPYAPVDEEEKIYLLNCVSSIKKTNEEIEVIVSTDREFTGYAKTVNRGLKKAKGNFLAICNNDLYVPAGWAERMKENCKDLRLVCAHEVDYALLDMMADVEEDIKWFFGGMWMMNRATFEEIGYLDEQFSPAFFEDSDYQERVLQAGGKLIHDKRIKVWHKQSSSTKKVFGDKYNEIFDTNRQRFIDKWNFDAIEKFK